jgi:hypothetical protein
MSKQTHKTELFLSELDELLKKHKMTIEVDLVGYEYSPVMEIELWNEAGDIIHDFNPDEKSSLSIGEQDNPS